MNHDLALESIANGYRIAILDGKKPIHKNFAQREIDKSEYEYWKQRGFNWGILLLQGLIVVDTDTPCERTKAWLKYHRLDDSPMMVKTRRGHHAYFRLETETEVIR